MLEDCLDLESQLLLSHRNQPRGLGDTPLLPRTAIQPDLGARNRDLLERAVDRFLAHPVRAMRIREISGDEDDLRADLFQQRAHDGDVGGTNGILAHLAGLIERQVEKTSVLSPEAHDLESRDGLALSADALAVPGLTDGH